jgi:hypothetical protein
VIEVPRPEFRKATFMNLHFMKVAFLNFAGSAA